MTSKLKRDFINRQYNDVLGMSVYLPYASNGKMVLYAGNNGYNADRASKHAGREELKPITITKGGNFILSSKPYKNFGKIRSDKIWDRASRRFVAEAYGKVRTFVCGANAVSTFRRIELPTALNNKKITEINGVNRVKLDQFRRQTYARLREQGMDKRQASEQSKTSVYRKVAIAEIRQDLTIAKNTKDLALQKDAHLRLGALKKQHKAEQAQKKLEIIDRRENQRHDFSQVRREKITQLKQEKAAAQQSGDRFFILAANKHRTAAVKELRTQNSLHARQARNDQDERAKLTAQLRTKAIYDRAERAAQQRGASPENAKAAAEMRVRHVTAKMELNKERSAVQQKPTTKAAANYVNKSIEFRDKRISDLQAQAKREERAYKGQPQRSQEYKNFERRHEPDALVSRSTLSNRYNAGELTAREYDQKSQSLESKIHEFKAKDYQATFGEAYTQSSLYSLSSPTYASNHFNAAATQTSTSAMSPNHGLSRSHSMSH